MGEAPARKPRIVLTGATGFIGRHLQRHLTAAGYELVAVVRPDSPRTAHILPGVAVCQAALADEERLAEQLREADFAVYAAGAVRGACAEDFTAANVHGVRAFAAAAARAMVQPRIVLISSLAASRPGLSWYAASKRAGEHAVRAESAVRTVTLRPPAVWGPGERELMPLLASIRRGFALRPGPRGQRLALLHAADLARAVVATLAHFDACAGGTYEIDDGTPLGYDWPTLASAVRGGRRVRLAPVPRALLDAVAAANLWLARRVRRPPMLTPGKVRELSEPYWLCDNRPFTAATGWSPSFDLGAGVEALFAPGRQQAASAESPP